MEVEQLRLLKTEMRKDVLYITVSQHDLGIFNGAKQGPQETAHFAEENVKKDGQNRFGLDIRHISSLLSVLRNSRIPRADFANMLVLSAGGYGHVPVPLLKQPEQPLKHYPMSKRKYLVPLGGVEAEVGAVIMS